MYSGTVTIHDNATNARKSYRCRAQETDAEGGLDARPKLGTVGACRARWRRGNSGADGLRGEPRDPAISLRGG